MNTDKPILFFINKFKRGGAEQRVVLLARTLHERGYDVHIGTMYPETPGDSYCEEGVFADVSVHCFQFSSLWDVSAYRDMLRYIAAHRIGMLYSPLEESNVVARILGLVRPSLRVVTQESNVASAKRLKFKLLDVVLNPFADVIVAVSEGVKKSILAYQPFYASKVHVFERPVRIPQKDAVCAPRAHNPCTIISVGSLTPQKRHDVLIQGFARLRQKTTTPVRLVIAGGGQEQARLVSLVAKLDVADAVCLTGSISQADVQDWYRRSNIFALASDWEGSSSVVKEAMACCLPVVGTDIVGIQEAVVDGETGYIVPAGDYDALAERLARLVDGHGLRETMGCSGYERARERYALEKHVTSLMETIA